MSTRSGSLTRCARMTDVQDDDWAVGTYAGARRASLRAVAATSVAERLDWLAAALRLAQSTGALDEARRERQLACDRLWAAG